MGDALAKIMQEIARAKMAPDADHAFLAELENSIVKRYRTSDPATSLAGAPAEAGMGGLEAPQEPLPVTPVEPLSRGPAPTPDMAGMTAELERVMAGS